MFKLTLPITNAFDINLLDDDPDVGDLEQVLATAGNLQQATGVGDGLLGVTHEGVLPVSKPLGMVNIRLFSQK